jgi:transposase
MAREITIEEKKELAKILFTREHLDQKVVALRVNVSEKTIGKWVQDGNWREMRRRLLLTKEAELTNLYEELEHLNTIIKSNPTKHADSKQADIRIKLTSSIRDLETKLGIAEIVESGIRFIKHVQQVGTTEQVLEMADLWNSFVQASMKK